MFHIAKAHKHVGVEEVCEDRSLAEGISLFAVACEYLQSNNVFLMDHGGDAGLRPMKILGRGENDSLMLVPQ